MSVHDSYSIFPGRNAQNHVLHFGNTARAREYPSPETAHWEEMVLQSPVPSLLPFSLPEPRSSRAQTKGSVSWPSPSLAWVAGEIGVSSFFPRFPPQPLRERFFIQYQIDFEYHPPKEYILNASDPGTGIIPPQRSALRIRMRAAHPLPQRHSINPPTHPPLLSFPFTRGPLLTRDGTYSYYE
ncbi:uncharacterized protein ARMOST_21271 [Armillaria ostoyae]|uniref:Uncharacterized protein n=1 Tax=Armillaria ostoyae TaxID=47428 RepID=A0A284S9P3_ARMOS|nr:uncharacterized protein ARMOST_21271 [Armillaria ostoyae]